MKTISQLISLMDDALDAGNLQGAAYYAFQIEMLEKQLEMAA